MPNKLSAYRAKRDFNITSEPQGDLSLPAERLRFVVQKHEARKLHYDFRLELDGTLKSWAIPKGPSLDPAEKRLAVHVEDHPLDYIDFQGTIPEHQYGAGVVEIWDSGTWEPQGDPAAGYRAGKLKFHLDGKKLQGGWNLVRTRLHASGNQEQWLLIKERDEHAHVDRNFDIAAVMPDRAAPVPFANGHKDDSLHPATLKNAVQAPLPVTLSPELAILVDTVPQMGNWIYEIKFDGCRVLARIAEGEVRLYTRDGKDWTAKLPKQVEAINALQLDNAWLDGELVVLDQQGIPSFQLLQNAFDEKSTAQTVFFIFDLPYLNGYDLRKTPLAERRSLLQRVLGESVEGPLRFSMALEESPEKLLENACLMSMEGIIGKRSDSTYTGIRSGDWVKLKCRKRQEFIIAGYTEPHGTRKFFGALLLAVYDENGELHYAGRVGTGFDRTILHSIHKQLVALEQSACPFKQVPRGALFAPTHWVAPQLVAEVSFAEWTHDGLLRQAVFHGLRLDKRAPEIKREEPVHPMENTDSPAWQQAPVSDAKKTLLHGMTISHPDRVIDPSSGLNKLDLVRYYDYVAPTILPFLQHRPVYLLRAPEGLGSEQFFQKHNTRVPIPGIETLDQSLDPQHEPMMVINSAQALIAAAQMDTIELHTCNATADSINQPDSMVFDLDPDPDLAWPSVILAAQLTKIILDELGLKSFLKTSGGKGLHVVVPLTPDHAWEVVNEFSHAIAQHMARTIPAHFSAKVGARNRIGKVFIDYMRNQRHASTIAPYSVRARPGLPVATPVAWEELATLTSATMWTIRSLPKRLSQIKNDPWGDYFNTRQRLTDAMRKRLRF